MIASRRLESAWTSLLLAVVICSCNCPQGSNTAFVATFDADALAQPPSTSGSFGPPGASLAVQGKLAVIQPGGLSSRAVRMDRDNSNTFVQGTVGGSPISSGTAYVWWRGTASRFPRSSLPRWQ